MEQHTIEPNLIGSPGGGMSPSKMKKYTERIERAVESLSPDQQGALQLAGQVNQNTDDISQLALNFSELETEIESEVSGETPQFIKNDIKGYINYSTGLFVQNYVTRTYFLKPLDGVTKIKIKIAQSDSIPAAIAFYKTEEISSEGYMKEFSIQSSTSINGKEYESVVPSGAKLCIVTNNNSGGFEPVFDVKCNSIAGLKKRVNALEKSIKNVTTTSDNVIDPETKESVKMQLDRINGTFSKQVVFEKSAQNGYIRYNDGEFITYPLCEIYKADASGIKSIKVKTASQDNVPAAIAFYSTNNILSSGYIKEYSIQALPGSYDGNEYSNVIVPDSAKLCVVTNNIYKNFTPQFITRQNLPDNLLQKIENAEKESKRANDILGAQSASFSKIQGAYVRYEDGVLISYPYCDCYSCADFIGVEILKVKTASQDAVPAAIAFYSTETISAAGYLKNLSLVAKRGLNGVEYEVNIPKEAKLIVVTNNTQQGFEPQFETSPKSGGLLEMIETGIKSNINISTDGIPKLFITSSLLVPNEDNTIIPLTASKNEVGDFDAEDVKARFVSIDNNFDDAIKISYQGNTSLYAPKKGFSIAFKNKHRFCNWLEMDEYHCKGYWSDWLHCRDLISNRIYEQIIMSRSENRRPYMMYNDFPANDIDMLVDASILCHIDGFPVELYINDVYWGLYSINIKKERKNYKLDKAVDINIMIDPEETKLTRSGFRWNSAEIRNPKFKTDKDGNVYDGDNPTEIPDGATKDCINSWLSKMESITNDSTKDQIADAINIREFVDTVLLLDFLCAWDSMCINTLWTSWDGIHFSPLPYDLDCTFGQFRDANMPEGDVLVGANYDCFTTKAYGNCPWLSKLMNYVLKEDFRTRYAELRSKGIFSYSNVETLFMEFTKAVGNSAYRKDTERWSYPSLGNPRLDGSHGGVIDSVPRIVKFTKDRLVYLDNKYKYIVQA